MLYVTEKVVEAIRQGERLSLSIEMSPTQGEAVIITNSDIIKNSFSLDRYVQSGDKLEIGSAIAGEVRFKLNNNNGKFDDVIFEGAEIKVSVMVNDTDSVLQTYQLGFFIIDEQPKKLSIISISALDRMVKLDRPYDPQNLFTYGNATTIAMVILHICVDCGVFCLMSDFISNIPTRSAIVSQRPMGENLTYRQVLQYICQIACCNAYFDSEGRLRIGWFGDFNRLNFTLSKYDRYSSTLEESSQTVNQLTISYYNQSTETETSASYPMSDVQGLTFAIEENPLSFSSANDEVVQSLYDIKFSNFTYRPFTAQAKPFFFLEPMDKIVFKDKNDNDINTVITHTTFKLNSNMQIQAKGESLTKTGYATLPPLTAEQKKVIEATTKQEVSARQLSLIEFNKAIAGGMGLKSQIIDGVEYSFEGAAPQESQYIMVKNSAGVAWTDEGWGENGPVFKYGISSNGEAILSSVQAYHINAELLTVRDLSAFHATIGGWSIAENEIYTSTKVNDGTTQTEYFTYFRPTVEDVYAENQLVWVSGVTSKDFDTNEGFGVYSDGSMRASSLLFYRNGDGTHSQDNPYVIAGLQEKQLNITNTDNDVDESYLCMSKVAGDYLYLLNDKAMFGLCGIDGKYAGAFISAKEDSVTSRIELFRSHDNNNVNKNLVCLRFSNSNGIVNEMQVNGSEFWFGPLTYLSSGYVDYENLSDVKAKSIRVHTTSSYLVAVSSSEKVKTNIASCDSVLDLFSEENSNIYSYNYKKTVSVPGSSDGMIADSVEEVVDTRTSYGFVIGENYNVPEQVLSADGEHIDLYSMAALNWKATQELLIKIQTLENKLNEMGVA